MTPTNIKNTQKYKSSNQQGIKITNQLTDIKPSSLAQNKLVNPIQTLTIIIQFGIKPIVNFKTLFL